MYSISSQLKFMIILSLRTTKTDQGTNPGPNPLTIMLILTLVLTLILTVTLTINPNFIPNGLFFITNLRWEDMRTQIVSICALFKLRIIMNLKSSDNSRQS